MKLTLTYGNGQTISLLITVVQVQIMDKPGSQSFDKNETTKIMFPVHNKFGTNSYRAAVGVNTKTMNAAGQPIPALTVTAKVVLSGPNGNMGVDKIQVGFVQYDTVVVDQAVYQNPGETLTAMYHGKPESAYGTAIDKFDSDDPTAWTIHNVLSVLDDATPELATGTISVDDSPREVRPLTYNQAAATVLDQDTWPKLDLIKRILQRDKFQLDVAAITSDEANGASALYYAEARARWELNLSGTFNLVYNAISPKDSTLAYTPDLEKPLSAPMSWSGLSVGAPTLEETSGPTANEIGRAVTFS